MKRVLLLLTPLQIIYIAIAIMTTVSVATYQQNTVKRDQNPVQQPQISLVQHPEPSTTNTQQVQITPQETQVSSIPSSKKSHVCGNGICEYKELCTPSSPLTSDCGSSYCQIDCTECPLGQVRICEAGICECMAN